MRRKHFQQYLFYAPKPRFAHGGDLNLGKRKTARFAPSKKWIHLVLKSKRAIGRHSFLNKEKRIWISRLIRTKARQNFIELGDVVVMGNHIHFKIRLRRAEDFKRFLRTITGRIGAFVTGAKKGRPYGKFWDSLAYTRVLTSALEELQLKGYFCANRAEREGGRKSRDQALLAFNEWRSSLLKLKDST